MVMIHGSYATTSTWKQMLSLVSGEYRCILIKLPGHCGTPDPTDFDTVSVETELSIIEAIIDKECAEPVHLVGHSYGGVVALALALKRRVKLSQLSLFEPVATWVLDLQQDLSALTIVDEFLNTYRRAIESNVTNACGLVIDFWGGGYHFGNFPESVKAMMAQLQDNNVRHWKICTSVDFVKSDLKTMTVPTTIVFGSQSNAIAKAIAVHLYELLPCSSLHEIKGASHGLVATHAKQCANVITKPCLS